MVTEPTPANSANCVRLTLAERRVLERVVLGETNKEVAQCLGCSARTVEFHLGHILRKTGFMRRTRLISIIAIRFAGASAATVADARLAGRLTKTEIRVFKHVLLGATNKEIAARLYCSARTVEFHVGNIFRKTGLDCRTRLMSAVATARVRASWSSSFGGEGQRTRAAASQSQVPRRLRRSGRMRIGDLALARVLLGELPGAR